MRWHTNIAGITGIIQYFKGRFLSFVDTFNNSFINLFYHTISPLPFSSGRIVVFTHKQEFNNPIVVRMSIAIYTVTKVAMNY